MLCIIFQSAFVIMSKYKYRNIIMPHPQKQINPIRKKEKQQAIKFNEVLKQEPQQKFRFEQMCFTITLLNVINLEGEHFSSM